ncbi:outer membrane protein assembly factor BamB [Geodermatophilus tzadiensis]|uniref:Outer membrane protein assembly factor BamB n=1 Tax=Geodermatophilus tzadiensis TaxID=1137988 RepID=A0A2T0U1P0_9ACTN|nr:PQQ-binding-like beta-propeller repeat protein [Geodermatophilus tzadiensis]PRY51815.1 outer membrane protein assembly factor BamB [Geodermatophilus tzadiensis]
MRPPPLRVWVWTAATLALVVVATLLWRGSSVAATDSTTAPEAAVPDAAPAAELTEAWTAEAGAPLPRRVVEGGRVLVTDEHGFAALDPVTGEEAWHYRRGDARLCDATAVDGLVVAVFRTADRCDEALALTAATGVRAWTRNLSLRGDATLSGTDQVVLAAGPTGVVVLDPVGDNVRWRYNPPEGCRLLGSDVGSAGVAVLQRCPGTAALQLRLFDGFSGQARWTRDVAVPADGTVRLTGADRLVGVVAGDTLLLSRADDGAALEELPLPAATDDPGTELLHQAGAGDLALVWARGTVWALDRGTGAPRWQLPALGLPSSSDETDAATVWVPEEGGFVQRDLATGAEVGRSAAGGLVPGGRTAVVGPALVYRLPDRVTGYR